MDQTNFTSPTNKTLIDADAESAIVLGCWNALIALISLPMNIFIIAATLCIPKTEFTPVYWLILALSVTDCILLVGLSTILAYGVSLDDAICKYGGALNYGAGYANVAIPLFMAWNRHAIICNTRFGNWFSSKGIGIMLAVCAV